MNITNVNVTRVNSDSKLEAMASVTIDNAIRINGFKVIDGEKGYFVAMPSRPDKNGEYRDTVYPITAEARKALIEAVLDEFTRDRLERGNVPDLEDGKLPWDEEPGREEPKDSGIPVSESGEAVPKSKELDVESGVKKSSEKTHGLPDIPLKEGKVSVKAQLAELSESAGKAIKTKAIKPKKEEVVL